jgi:glucose/arabinose dehydrogenase/mono/diheme cytochrome c family protein
MSLQPRATARMGLLALALLLGSIDCARADAPPAAPKSATSLPCRNPSAAGLTLPRGFCATVFADHIGHARHLAVSPAGVVYVNTWSGSYYPSNDVLPDGGFLVALKDRHASGKADLVKRFGESVETGGTGGTGIAVGNGYLYAEINDRIVRYALAADEIAPGGAAQTLVSGLPLTGQHPMHPFFIGEDGFLYVDVASATNACQTVNGGLRSRGADPCTELQTRAGLWRYAADKLNQPFSAAERYATGIRNTEGFAVDTTHHRVYITQHGRDELHSMWPDLYDAEQEATLPSEELLLLQAGNDYGWPECYYDPARQSLVLAPEYGGDGGKSLGVCAKKSEPLQAYPAHWAPMAMAIYQGEKFPAHYHEGLFIAFHGSWNRAPYAQEGYNIVFQPMANGSPSASCEIFADGFAGGGKNPGKAAHRPSGLAVGPDGALYVADDVGGRIYRITYQGDAGARDAAAHYTACPSLTASAGPIQTTHSNAVANLSKLPVPPGSSREMLALGAQIYSGDVGGAACTGCHGENAKGSPLGPDLTLKHRLWSDGSVAGIAHTITEGVPTPKQYRNPMLPKGGSGLSEEQIGSVAAYLWALSHQSP